jgi:DNA invertase Pin-like site-specific DNA recombinase
MHHARSYLRASTDEQDASRARAQIEAFAEQHGLAIVGTYVENESGAKLQRPELFRLIADSRSGDLLLIEQVDRLSRLTDGDWRQLRAELNRKQIRVVAMDLPTSWLLAASADDFTARMFGAVNGMMLDVLAAVARKDYEDRRRRQAQGVAKAKTEGRYRGRPEDVGRNDGIASMLRAGESWSAIQAAFGCSRATIAKVAKRGAAERQLEGTSAAKARGVYKGRPATIDPAGIAALKAQGLGASEIAKRLGVGRASVYRVLMLGPSRREG